VAAVVGVDHICFHFAEEGHHLEELDPVDVDRLAFQLWMAAYQVFQDVHEHLILVDRLCLHGCVDHNLRLAAWLLL